MHAKHRVAPRFAVLSEYSLAILYCCKVGSKSFCAMEESLVGPVSRPVPTEDTFRREMQNYSYRAQFVREPTTRIISAYRYFAYLHYQSQHGTVSPMSQEMRDWIGDRTSFTFEEFVLGAFEYFPEDKHIAPQYGTHYGLANFTWPFEDLPRGWKKLQDAVPGLPELPRRNTGHPWTVEYTDLAAMHITEFYGDDFEWYSDVCGKAEFCAP